MSDYPTRTALENIAEALLSLDSKGADKKITKSEYEDLLKNNENNKIIKKLIGEENISYEWNEFKYKLIDHQEKFGIVWKVSPGNSGPLVLSEEINLPEELGLELAQKLMLEFEKNINLRKNIKSEIEKFIPSFYNYFNNEKINFKNLKDKLKSFTTKDNKKYKFTTKSHEFELLSDHYAYPKREVDLGNEIRVYVEELLGLNMLNHSQESRKKGKYQNTDLEGYKIIESIDKDSIEIYSIELKPSNKIDQVSDAISQAVNYKSTSHRTYIAIPKFDYKNFYDLDRYKMFYRLCEENRIGIISINLDSFDKVEGVEIALSAPYHEIEDISKIKDLVFKPGNGPKRELCPMCHRVVTIESSESIVIRDNCKWKIGDNCFKILLENKIIQ